MAGNNLRDESSRFNTLIFLGGIWKGFDRIEAFLGVGRGLER